MAEKAGGELRARALGGLAELAARRGDTEAAIANTYIDLGDLGGSAGALASALSEAEELDDPILRARVHWSQSRLHTVEGRHELAARFAFGWSRRARSWRSAVPRSPASTPRRPRPH